MLGYTESLTTYQKLTNNDESSNTTLFNLRFNQRLRQIYGLNDWKFLEDSKTISTVSGTQFYDLPFNFKKLINVTQTNGTTVHSPKKCSSREMWDKLNGSSVSSDIPEWFYLFNKQLGLYPKSSSSGNTITYNYKKRTKDLSVADYTDGTIAVTNDSATVTGTGTTFTKAMEGRWIKLDDEKEWYRIETFVSATELTLKDKYQGTTTTGASYTIAEVSELPEDYQDLPVVLAVVDYYRKEKDRATAKDFEDYVKEQLLLMKDRYASLTENVVVIDEEVQTTNPNLFITL